jgi:hypothetical protein
VDGGPVPIDHQVKYIIEIENKGGGAGSLDMPLVDDFDEDHLRIDQVNDGTSSEGDAPVSGAVTNPEDEIRWGSAPGEFQFDAGETWTFTYLATTEGTFAGSPPNNAPPCNPNNNEYPVDNDATIENLLAEARLCVTPPGVVRVNKSEAGSTPSRSFDFTLDGPSGHFEGTTSGQNGHSIEFNNLIPGDYVLCEVNMPEHYDSTLTPDAPENGQECTDPFNVPAGEGNAVVFNINNIPCPATGEPGDPAPGGTIIIDKSIPANSGPATFTYTVRGPLPSNTLRDEDTISFPAAGGDDSVTLTTPAGVVGDFLVSESENGNNDKFAPNDPVEVTITPETDCGARVAFETGFAPPNGEIRVIKTEEPTPGNRRNAIGKWTFYLTGPSGTKKTKLTNTKGADHRLRFGNRAPGEYTLCERFFSGWKSNLGRGQGGFNKPNGDRCVSFTLAPNQTRTFRVNNVCPRGRRAPAR